MIYCNLKDCARYSSLHPGFERAFAALTSFVENPPAVGVLEIDGRALYASVQAYEPRKREGSFEAHEKYIDIQFILRGNEEIDVAPLSECEEKTPYDEEGDYALYDTERYSTWKLSEGELAIFFPEDAHRPGLHMEATSVNKIVVKVRI